MNNKLSLLVIGSALVAGALLYHTREYQVPSMEYLMCDEKVVFIGRSMQLHEDGRATAWTSAGRELTYIPETHECYITEELPYASVKSVQ